MAIQEQTRFVNGDFTAAGVVLIDGETRRHVLYAPNDELRAYTVRAAVPAATGGDGIVAWVKGDTLQPAQFTLELPG